MEHNRETKIDMPTLYISFENERKIVYDQVEPVSVTDSDISMLPSGLLGLVSFYFVCIIN